MEIRIYDGNPFDTESGYISIREEDEDCALELVKIMTRYGMRVLIWEEFKS